MAMERGTPEYQQAYDAEMARLETAAVAPASTTDTVTPEVTEASTAATEQKATTTEATDKTPEPEKHVETETEKALRLQLEDTKKALKGTQRYASKLAEKFTKFERDQADARHRASRPALLDNVDGLTEAIQHVTRAPATRDQLPDAQPFGPDWVSTVARGVPDVDALLADPQFNARAAEMRDTNGWEDPVIAIRDLQELKQQHVTHRAVGTATEQARKDYEARHAKLLAQRVPGGGGAGPQSKPAANADDEVKKWENMPADQFEKERARVMGYG